MPRGQYPRKRRSGKKIVEQAINNNPPQDPMSEQGAAVNMPSTRRPSYVTKVVQRVMIKEEIKRTFSDGQTTESVETFPAVHQVWE